MDRSFIEQVRYLARYLHPHRKIITISLILTIVSTAFGLVQPYFAKIMIDEVLLAKKFHLLLPLLSVFILLYLISFVIRVGNSYIYTRYSARLLFKMREDLFYHLQKIPLTVFSRKKCGDIFSRIASDMSDIQALITETLPQYLLDFLTCLITAVILLALNWPMALMSFVFLPPALYILSRIQPKILGLSRSVAETNADISHFLFEALGGASLIRALGAEKLELSKLENKHNGLLDILMSFQILKAFSGLVPMVFIILNTLIVFGYGGFLVYEGSLTIGALVAFSIYQGRLFGPLQGMLGGFLTIQKSKVALDRVHELLAIEPTVVLHGDSRIEPDKFKGNIHFENVTFSYDHEETILKDQSFQIPAGKVTALVGPSGAGKTTICHLLMRLFDPDHGRITLDGVDLRHLNPEWLKHQMALVSQDIFLFHTSIMENIRYSRPEAGDAQVKAAAEAACIHDFIQALPAGYQTEVGDRGIRLSGGQKQRISIARAILLNPKILILDEATAFLDSTVEERLKKTIKSLMINRTILVVSHRISSIEDADQVIFLDSPALVQQDSGAEVFHKKLQSHQFDPKKSHST